MEITAEKRRRGEAFRPASPRLVGMAGFEPTTSRTPSVRATRLRHIPIGFLSAAPTITENGGALQALENLLSRFLRL